MNTPPPSSALNALASAASTASGATSTSDTAGSTDHDAGAGLEVEEVAPSIHPVERASLEDVVMSDPVLLSECPQCPCKKPEEQNQFGTKTPNLILGLLQSGNTTSILDSAMNHKTRSILLQLHT